MIVPTRSQWIIGGSALGAIVLVIVIKLSIPKHGTVPAKEQRTLDSLAITRPSFQATQDTLVLRETTYVRRVDTLVHYATKLETESNTIHARADSLAIIARQTQDTVTRWYQAYVARTDEADTLRKALTITRAALDTETLARQQADQRAANAAARLGVTEALNTRLATDVKNATECKFLWMRCPSRGAVALTALALGAAGGYIAHRP